MWEHDLEKLEVLMLKQEMKGLQERLTRMNQQNNALMEKIARLKMKRQADVAKIARAYIIFMRSLIFCCACVVLVLYVSIVKT